MSQAPNSKSMSIGESGLTVLFAAPAFLCMIGAAKAVDAPFAFHASLSAAASLAAAFAILNRYFDRSPVLPAQEINGRPNYNMARSSSRRQYPCSGESPALPWGF